MISKERFGIGFTIGFIILVIYTGINNQKFVDTISSGMFTQAILFYLLSRVDYLLILISIMLLKVSTPAKDLIGGILLVWAIDIISFPRLPMTGMTVDKALLANSDALFMTRILSLTGWEYSFAWKFYYMVLPIILIIAVGYILGFVNLGRRLVTK